jgi:hypothetical protein
MREKVRALDYVMTIHAEEEMADDDLIAGNTLADTPLIVVAKLA